MRTVLAISALAAALLSTGVAAVARDAAPVRVLLVHQSDLMLPAAVEQDAITREALRAALGAPIEFYSEGYDEVRFPGRDLETEFTALLEKKYAQRPPQLIVAHGTAIGTVVRYRARLWPQTPLMFASVTAQRMTDPEFPRGIPGTAVRFDVAGTVDLALRLQPDARRLLILTGTSPFDRDWVKRILSALEPYRGRIPIQVITDRTVEEFVQLASTLDPRTIVLPATVSRDAAGRVQPARDVSRRVAAASTAPVYSLYPRNWHPDAVGGSVIDWKAQSRDIGEIARKLLAGDTPASGVAVMPPKCMVDWRRLRHWNLPLARVPRSCEVLFRELSLWERYRKTAVITVLVLLAQAALIVALLRQRRMRRKATLEAEHRRTELIHAARLATVAELSASIAHEINQPLSAILTNATTGELLLAGDDPPLSEVKEILGEIRRDDERASEVIRTLRELLRKHPVEMVQLNVNDAVSATLHLVESTALKRGVTIAAELGSGLPRVNGERVQLEQVLLILFMNAFDAMDGIPAGKRILSISTVEKPRGTVQVTVGDTGHGISSERMDRLFERFFSTKPEGMGLGLSIARSIVQAHDGRIWALPRTDGAMFCLTIPAARGKRRMRSATAEPGIANADLAGGEQPASAALRS